MKKVLMIVDTSRLTGRDLLSGAERYISSFARWEVATLAPNYLKEDFSRELRGLNLRQFDGFFVCYTENISPILKTRKPKIIHHTPREMLDNTSRIVTHSAHIGQQAAKYFLSLGFKNFAYCGFEDIYWSQQRHRSFCEMLMQNGIGAIQSFVDTPDRTKSTHQKKLTAWLKELPKPVCVFACNDDRAIYILEACKAAGINIPEEVAVLGVDNDELVCNLSSPPLSSMALNFENAGFQAARHLDRLMDGEGENATLKVEPTEIITRKSTDIFAVEDKELIAAMVYIRNNYHRPVQVADVVRATSISRRELEYRFKSEFKKTIKDELNRLRVEHIKKQLLHSREPIYHIANQLEFTDPEHFSRYFTNLTGISPSAFRRQQSE